MRPAATLVHLTTVDASLAMLLLPQLVAFREAGYRVIGVSAAGPYVEDLREAGIEHVALQNSTRGMDVAADVAAARQFSSILRRLQPTIVHTHNPKPGVYGRIVAGLRRVPHVVNTIHGLYAMPDDPFGKRMAVYGLERLAASFSDAELVQNPEDVPVLRRLGIPAHRIHLLGNGVDLTRFDPDRHGGDTRKLVRRELGISEDKVLFLTVGRLVREKGYRELFSAVRTIKDRLPDAHFVVAGPDDPDKPDGLTQRELDVAADEVGIQFLGARHDVERLYAAADVFVLPSHREGFSRSGMESAAMGLPMIGTDVRGIRQVVDHEETGLLVPRGDASGLAAAIARLAAEGETRHTWGRAARRKAVVEFDDRRQIEITLAVYEQLLGRQNPAATA